MKNVRFALFRPTTGTVTEVICNSLDDIYTALGCETFDIANRDVCGKRFDIYVDDEGLLKENPIVSALSKDLKPMLVGNLLFAHHDRHGNSTAVSDDDIAHLKRCVVNVFAYDTDDILYKAMFPVDY